MKRHSSRSERLIKRCSVAAKRSLRLAVVVLTTAAFANSTSALAQANESDEVQSDEIEQPSRRIATGVLPQLAVLLRVPEDLRLYDPGGPSPPDEHIES